MTESLPPPPLLAFAGARPPAPRWFTDALDVAPERTTLKAEGAELEVLAWGERGKPAILMLHGGQAHADWWSFMAPFFLPDYRVIAPSWSGMGRSSWRSEYTIDTYVRELMAVATEYGAFAAPERPVILAHSFGGFPTMACAAVHGERFSGAILLDAPIVTPEAAEPRRKRAKESPPPRETRLYASEAEALGRFRFQPAQTCENAFIADHIARLSLHQMEREGERGWTWLFDPFMWSRLKHRNSNKDLAGARCRMAVMWGQHSPLFPADVIEFARRTAPQGTAFIEIPEARHHVMVDQPIALVTAVRSLLAGWRQPERKI